MTITERHADRILDGDLADHPLRTKLQIWRTWAEVQGNVRKSRPLAPDTIDTYLQSVLALLKYLEDVHGLRPEEFGEITDIHLWAWIKFQRDAKLTDGTISIRFRSLRPIFRFALNRGWLAESPFEGVNAVKVPLGAEKVPPLLTVADIDAIIATCTTESKGAFEQLRAARDRAMFAIWVDTGCRLGEIANMRLFDDPERPHYGEWFKGHELVGSDLDLRHDLIRLFGKTGLRWNDILPTTKLVIEQYLKLRAQHRFADEPRLWLGKRGPMSETGLYQMVRTRAESVGLKVNPHLFRHQSAQEALDAGMSELEVMTMHGWETQAMLRRYTQKSAPERAQKAHKRLAVASKYKVVA